MNNDESRKDPTMRTIRLRPLRRKTGDEVGCDRSAITGTGLEVWIAGTLLAIADVPTDTDEAVQLVWTDNSITGVSKSAKAAREAILVLVESGLDAYIETRQQPVAA
jgi:hypothetical protein